MLEKNVDVILDRIGESDTVLDIGGWAQPFNRANYVMDIMPYESRGIFNSLGPKKEFFTKDSWIMHDISSRCPLPFKDKQIDFVICSHTLEDIRDPIRLCSEIVRVGRAGYIEMPSRIVESIMGLEGKHYAGYCHHRWLVEIEGLEITFRFKTQLLNESWRYHLPKSYEKTLSEEQWVTNLFWEGSFQYREVLSMSFANLVNELEDFIKRRHVYPRRRYVLDEILTGLSHPKTELKKWIVKSPALKSVAEKLLGHEIAAPRVNAAWDAVEELESK